MNNLNNKEYNIELISDPKFYLENFTKIKNKEGKGLVPFILKEAQKDLFNTLKKNSRIMIIKARQIGFSTSITGWIYHKTITTSGVTSALIGYNNDLTAELLDKIKTFYRTTPDALKPTIHYNTKFEISFPKVDSKILVLPSTENVGRGYTINYALCLSGDTEVIMRDFTSKKIKDIQRGEEVINGKGGFSKVSNIFKRKNDKKLLSVVSYGARPLVLTDDHLVLTRKFITGRPVWKKASELTKKDYLAYPYFQCRNRVKEIEIPEIKSRSNNKIHLTNRKIPITPEFGLFVGWYLAEGTSGDNKVTLSVHKNEVEKILRIIDVIRPYVGKVNVYYKKGESNSAVVALYGKEFSSFIGGMFGHNALEKNINLSVWNWGWEVNYSILRGLIDGDGYMKRLGSAQITTISPKLSVSVKRLMVSLRLGLPGIYKNEFVHRYGVKSQTRYDIILGGKGNYKLRRKLGYELPVYDNKSAKWRTKNMPGINQGGGYWKRGKFHYWAKISSISEAPNEEHVYDLSLEGEPHSFLTHAGVVKNCTEVPFWDKAEEKMMTLEASVPINGKIIIESSPGAVGDVFHRMWVSDNDYVKKEYGWWWDYSLEEIEIIQRRMNNPRKFANNYSLEFLTSGRSVFDAETLRKQRKNILKVGDVVKLHDGTEHIVYEDNGFRIYKPPRRDGVYVLGNDNAEGVAGGDYSVITIFDRSNGEEVGFWRGHTPPDKLAKILNRWGRHYNNALAVVECEAHGNVVLNCLKQLLYPSIYFRPSKFDTLSNPWSEKMGWKTTKLTRPLLVDDFEQAVRDGLLTIHSKEIIDEMTVFAFDSNNNMRALDGYHDDAIFSAGLAYQGFKVLMATTPTQLQYWQHLPPAGY